ncbi:putative mitochondrial acyltransferase [Leptomonas pyrrhocoris]|uniref:Putative mitochondrial acyltransferase n=1 Tax=Leptomonas pyrrhocoris TaxID=157538 RepID=A0A0N0VDN6_LEPPY|nr:putative mitochondrial acyltransferase [Leptomonas pyrrhocoris]KPA75601.1 putative mitochondrial acyltransferase [Leptomonas pyrrhocoris]|eukprot:XP_015654040.1 putative mitochondrial acyltransferase [Leptomonas pyrrhocoris]
MTSVKLGAALGFAVWYLLLRMRWVPVPLMRAWFFLVSLCIIFPTSAMTSILVQLHRLGVSAYHTQRLCIVPLVCAFRAVWWLSPHIRMHMQFDANVDGKPTSWADIELHHQAFVGNHTSFWDVFAFLCIAPMSHLVHTRTMMKASLRDIPIFGGIFDRVGNFPVYFKSDEDGHFEVDKEKQAAVQVGVEAHLSSGGSLAIFPEGAINKNPRVLQTFRYGTFATIFEHRMPVYYFVHLGAERTWPRWTMVGGMPTDMHIRAGRFPIDFDKEDSKAVAHRMQLYMQKVYNELLTEWVGPQAVEVVVEEASLNKKTS